VDHARTFPNTEAHVGRQRPKAGGQTRGARHRRPAARCGRMAWPRHACRRRRRYAPCASRAWPSRLPHGLPRAMPC